MLLPINRCYVVQHGPKVHSDIRSISPDLPIYSVTKYFPTLKAANNYVSNLKPSDRFYLAIFHSSEYEFKEDFKL